MPRPGATAARLAPSEARRPARDRGAEERRAGLITAPDAGAATMETGGDLTKERCIRDRTRSSRAGGWGRESKVRPAGVRSAPA